MAGGAADQRPHPRQHLLDMERLGDVVVGAGVDAGHLVAPAVAGGQDQHRHLAAVAPPALDDADAVHLRQADVEHDRVVGLGVAEEMPFLAVDRRGRRRSRHRQAHPTICRFRSLSSSTTSMRMESSTPVTLRFRNIWQIWRAAENRPAAVLGRQGLRCAPARPLRRTRAPRCRAGPSLPRHQHHDHADGLATAVLLRRPWRASRHTARQPARRSNSNRRRPSPPRPAHRRAAGSPALARPAKRPAMRRESGGDRGEPERARNVVMAVF